MSLRAFERFAACALAALALPIAITAPASASRKPAPPADGTPPTQPANLRVTAVTQTSASLAWSPSTDNVGVRSYSLWDSGLSGVVSATHPQTTATWTGLRPGPAYLSEYVEIYGEPLCVMDLAVRLGVDHAVAVRTRGRCRTGRRSQRIRSGEGYARCARPPRND